MLRMCPNWRMLTNWSRLASASKTPTGTLFLLVLHPVSRSSPSPMLNSVQSLLISSICPNFLSCAALVPLFLIPWFICKKCVFVNAALSCADLQGSCVNRWKSVNSWVGWGNQWDVAYASWSRACMATHRPNMVENVAHERFKASDQIRHCGNYCALCPAPGLEAITFPRQLCRFSSPAGVSMMLSYIPSNII